MGGKDWEMPDNCKNCPYVNESVSRILGKTVPPVPDRMAESRQIRGDRGGRGCGKPCGNCV